MNAPLESLNRLIGQRELTSQMGTTSLQQAVTAQWVLERRFIELHFLSTLPASEGQPSYDGEAIPHSHSDCFVGLRPPRNDTSPLRHLT